MTVHLGIGVGHAVSLPALALVGLFVGWVAGMFGVGGGFLLTPLLMYVFGVPAPVAVGSALCQKCGTSIASFVKYRALGRGEPRFDLVMMGGSVIGVDAGTRLLHRLSQAGSLRGASGRAVPVVDVVLDLMIHDLDLALDLCRGQEVEALGAIGRSVFSGDIDHAQAQFSARGGPLCSFVASRVTEHKVRSIEATTPSEFIVADLLRKEISIFRNTRAAYRAQEGGVAYQQRSLVEQVQVATAEPLMLELQDFLSCVRSGKAPTVSAGDAIRSLRAVHDLTAQIRSGQERAS